MDLEASELAQIEALDLTADDSRLNDDWRRSAAARSLSVLLQTDLAAFEHLDHDSLSDTAGLTRSGSVITTATDLGNSTAIFLDAPLDTDNHGDESTRAIPDLVGGHSARTSIDSPGTRPLANRHRILEPYDLNDSKPAVEVTGRVTRSQMERSDWNRLYQHAKALQIAAKKLYESRAHLIERLRVATSRIGELEAELSTVRREREFYAQGQRTMSANVQDGQFYKDSYESLLVKHKELSKEYERLRTLNDVTSPQLSAQSTGTDSDTHGCLSEARRQPQDRSLAENSYYHVISQRDLEISALKMRLKSLKDEYLVSIEAYKRQLSSATDKTTELTEIVATLTEQTRRQERELDRLLRLEPEIADVKQNFNSLLDDYNTKQYECNKALEELQAHKEITQKLQEDLDRSLERATASDAACEETTRRLRNLELDLSKSKEAVHAAKSRIAELEEALTSAETVRDELQDQLHHALESSQRVQQANAIEIDNFLNSIEQLSQDLEQRNTFVYRMYLLAVETARSVSLSVALRDLELSSILNGQKVSLSDIFDVHLDGEPTYSRIHRLNNGGLIPSITQRILLIFTELVSKLGTGWNDPERLRAEFAKERDGLHGQYELKIKGLLHDLSEARRFVAEAAGREEGLQIALRELKERYRDVCAQLSDAQQRVSASEMKVGQLQSLREAEQREFINKLRRVVMREEKGRSVEPSV
ncbi:hypothetical protein GMRT_15894 [Giardia muris]|uniref:Uncharacterized protein n=1 Tax=Giardia muris TaxID=5742 RepID=A0A4Z1T790_GIAMU|nr:hypothetical protein GMRT_15894 [Giardia muris]|eukprot:TNJ29943.1 hypothetical protein GMRT_15894 [Giardia muris]